MTLANGRPNWFKKDCTKPSRLTAVVRCNAPNTTQTRETLIRLDDVRMGPRLLLIYLWGQIMKSQQNDHLRRQAVLIASQLPDNTADALLVLDYARDLVVEFFGVSDNVTAFPAASD